MNKDNTRASEADQLQTALLEVYREYRYSPVALLIKKLASVAQDHYEADDAVNDLATTNPEAAPDTANLPSSPPPDTLELDKIKARFVELDLMEQALNSGRDMYKYKLARLKDLEDRLEAALQKKLQGENDE